MLTCFWASLLMLILLFKLLADVAACFTAASAAVADQLSVQVLMLWLVRLLVALASNSSRLHDPPSPVHGQSMHAQSISTMQQESEIQAVKHLGIFSSRRCYLSFMLFSILHCILLPQAQGA